MRIRLSIALCLCLLSSSLPAQVLLKPANEHFQPLRTKSIQARTRIERGIASTTLTLVFANIAKQRVEADLIYTVRPGTVVTGFAYWFKDEKVVARIVERERASEIYANITRPARDPALVELIGKRTFRARIFPVQPDADLRVEIRMVQALENGRTFILPMRMPKGDRLENLDVEVRVEERPSTARVTTSLPMTTESGALKLRAQNHRPQDDLRVTVTPLAAERGIVWLYAARSGGPTGYFALAVTRPVATRNARIRIVGVPVEANLPRKNLAAGETWLLTGRYRKAGTAKVVLEHAGGSPINLGTITFPDVAEPNHPATKLWAAQQIEHLGTAERHRARVVALSTRFGIPSAHTSWLAIPTEERKPFEQMIRRSRARQVARLLAREVAAGRGRSGTARSLERQLDELVKSDPALSKTHLMQEMLYRQQARHTEVLAQELVKNRPDSPAARSARANIRSLSRWTQLAERHFLQGMLAQERHKLIREVVQAQLAGNAARQRAITNRLAVLSRETRVTASQQRAEIDQAIAQRGAELAGRLSDTLIAHDDEGAAKARAALDHHVSVAGGDRERLLREQLARRLGELARRIAPEQGAVHRRADEFRKEVRKLEERAALKPASLHADAERIIAWDHSRELSRQILELQVQGADPEMLGERMRELETQAAKTHQNAQSWLRSEAHRHWRIHNDYAKLVAEVGANHPDSLRAKDRSARLSQLLGSDMTNQAVQNQLVTVLYSLRFEEDQANLDKARIAHLRRQRAHLLEAMGDAGKKLAQQVEQAPRSQEDAARREYLRVLRERPHDQVALNAAIRNFRSRAADWPLPGTPPQNYMDARLERLRLDVELDRLEDEPVTPEIHAQVAALRAKRDEIRARMGDPLVTWQGPQDARSVVAVLPGGELKPMAWNPLTRRWEARFDIPAHAPEGAYTVRIVAVMPDGTRRTSEQTFHVDVTAPNGELEVRRHGDRVTVRVQCSADTARVEVVLPGDRLVPLDRVRPGEFTKTLPYPGPGDIAAWLTDGAHNRTMIKGRLP